MKYLKKFNEGFFNKSSSWEKIADNIYKTYNGLKSGKYSKNDYIVTVTIDSHGFMINSMNAKFQSETLSFSKDRLDVTDMEEYEFDFDTKGIPTKREDEKGVYKITQQQYDKYYKQAVEMDNWLDDQSETDMKNKKMSVSSSGDFNLNIDEEELAKEELNDKVKEHIGEFIGESFEFELVYHLFESGNKRERMVERVDLKIKDIRLEVTPNEVAFDIYISGVLDENCIFSVRKDDINRCEYHEPNLNILGSRSKTHFQMRVDDSEKTRKEKREGYKKYPSVPYYEITPTKYNTIEMLKYLVSISEELSNYVKR